MNIALDSKDRIALAIVTATLMLGCGPSVAGGSPAGAGLQIGANVGLDAGPYRGDGTGWGYGLDIGFGFDRNWSLVAVFDIGSSNRGDADPITRIAIEGRFRKLLGIDAATVGAAKALVPYVGFGFGAGVVAYPLAHLDAALVTLPIEIGLELPAGESWAISLALRDRPMLTIGTGDPVFSFLNRIGVVLSVRF